MANEDDGPTPHLGKSPARTRGSYGYEDYDHEKTPDGDEEIHIREHSNDEGSDENYHKMTRQERMDKFRAQCEAYFQKKEEDRLRADETRRLKNLQLPNKFGWYYTNGYYKSDPEFGINPKLLDHHLKQEAMFERRRRKREPETFTHRFKRNFWPPHYLLKNKCMFRTRGVYFFPEVLANPIPECENDFEKCTKLLRNTEPILMDEDEYDRGRGREGGGDGGQRLTKTKTKGSWDSWYYDDEDGHFHRKVVGFKVDYYFDAHNSCWRRKAGNKKPWGQITPYDFYYDQGVFSPRDFFRGNNNDIVFDERIGIWTYNNPENQKRPASDTDLSLPKKLSTTPEDFFFDEEECLWKEKIDSPVEEVRIENDANGRRWIKRHIGEWRGVSGNSPDDYFFDENAGKFRFRLKRQAHNFVYSTNDGVWRPRVNHNHMHLHHHKPSDYFFEDGMFKLKDPGQEHLYRQWKYAKIYVRKNFPKSGLLPQDYYYDYEKGLWLPRALRLTVKTKKEELPWRGGKPVKQERILSRDDWYFDMEEGIYMPKTEIGIKENAYYFDQEERAWKSIEFRNKHRVHILPGDFYFSGEYFILKDKESSPETYAYDEKYGVYRLKGSNFKKGHPDHFYFDYGQERWNSVSKEDHRRSVDGSAPAESTHLDPSGHYVKKYHERKSPDDYYFDESAGQFRDKGENNEEYFFAPSEGCYKHAGGMGPSRTGLSPNDFYYDDLQGIWILKVNAKDTQYYYDQNNKFYRRVPPKTLSKTKSGLGATDYYFSPNAGKWFPILNHDPSRSRGQIKVKDEKLNWDPARNDDKPWLRAAPIRYILDRGGGSTGEQTRKKAEAAIERLERQSVLSRASRSSVESQSKQRRSRSKGKKHELELGGWEGSKRTPEKPRRGRR